MIRLDYNMIESKVENQKPNKQMQYWDLII